MKSMIAVYEKHRHMKQLQLVAAAVVVVVVDVDTDAEVDDEVGRTGKDCWVINCGGACIGG